MSCNEKLPTMAALLANLTKAANRRLRMWSLRLKKYVLSTLKENEIALVPGSIEYWYPSRYTSRKVYRWEDALEGALMQLFLDSSRLETNELVARRS